MRTFINAPSSFGCTCTLYMRTFIMHPLPSVVLAHCTSLLFSWLKIFSKAYNLSVAMISTFKILFHIEFNTHTCVQVHACRLYRPDRSVRVEALVRRYGRLRAGSGRGGIGTAHASCAEDTAGGTRTSLPPPICEHLVKMKWLLARYALNFKNKYF